MAQKNVKFVGKTSILPISTMLYMSESDLQERLKILTNLFKLDYAYICHKGECGKKDHIHIILRTQAKQFSNIDKIRECLFEICDVDTDTYKKGQSKPCKPFVESKSIRDWYLYSMHNKEYLSEKGEFREFEYTSSDIKGSPNFIDDMQEYTNNFVKTETDLEIISACILNGLSDFEILTKLSRVSSDNLFSTLKGISELRKHIEVDQSAKDSQFYEMLYSMLLRHEKSKNWLINSKLGKYETDGHNVQVKVLEKLLNEFIDYVCNYDMLYHYLND